MPRARRHHYQGATYHVICRGNHQQPIFFAPEDYRRFCRLLAEGIERFDHQIVAYCLMTNHIHLAVRAGEDSISEVLHNVLFRYAQGHNAKHELSGHLFEGRFKAKLVNSLGYMRALIRYIHMNPVKARIVGLPEQYHWSSHGSYLSEEPEAWTSPHIGLECFGTSPSNRVQFYREFLGFESEDDGLFEFDRPPSESRLDRLLVAIAQEFGVDSQDLKGRPRTHQLAEIRAAGALVAKRAIGSSLQEVARHFEQSPSTMSKAVSRLLATLPKSPELRHQIDRLCKTHGGYEINSHSE